MGAFAMDISQGRSANTDPFWMEEMLLSLCLLLGLVLQLLISISMTTKETFTLKKRQSKITVRYSLAQFLKV